MPPGESVAVGVHVAGHAWSDLLSGADTNLWHFHAKLLGMWLSVRLAVEESGIRSKQVWVVVVLDSQALEIANIESHSTPFVVTPETLAAIDGQTEKLDAMSGKPKSLTQCR
jgi:hypothetical protein